MPISDWFRAREERAYVSSGRQPTRSEVPDGVWAKCDACGHIIYEGELAENLRVCRACDHHLALTAPQRIDLIVDRGSFEETDAGLTSCDPLSFDAAKPYTESIEAAQARSGLPEALVTGRASIGGHGVVVGAMDFRFVGASMGSVVGEKATRVLERAARERRPAVLVIASGGARMQEGMLSLMQMAKTAAAVRRLADAGVPYIAILTNPTYGGVTASFAVLADVVLAEPRALIGFTGQRIIEQTIRQKLPKGFQTSEFLLERGFIDQVVHRVDLRDRIALLLDYLHVEGGESA